MSAEDVEKIAERIRKLLNLAENTAATPDEAALAARRATEMALRYGLDLENLRRQRGEKGEQIGEMLFGKRIFWSSDRMWIYVMCGAVARVNGCVLIITRAPASRRAAILIVGKPTAARIASMMVDYVIEAMMRDQKASMKKQPFPDAIAKKRFRKSFRLGYASAIASKVKTWFEDLGNKEAGKGLVLFAGKELVEAQEHVNTDPDVKTAKHGKRKFEKNGLFQGYTKGQQLNLSQQVETTANTHAKAMPAPTLAIESKK